MTINIGKFIDGMQSFFLQQSDDLFLNESQTNRLFEISSSINAVKEFHNKTIDSTKRILDNALRFLNGIHVEGATKEKEIKKYRRKLHKYWKDIKKADSDVMRSANELLDTMKVVEMYLADKKTTLKD